MKILYGPEIFPRNMREDGPPPWKPLRLIAHGGGIQTTAMSILWARGDLSFDAAVMANVGDDSENPETIAYIEQYMKPYMRKHNLPFYIVQKTRKDGSLDTIYQRLMRPTKSIGIPVKMSGNGAPGRRSCTFDFKIEQLDQFCRRFRDGHDVHMAIGFTLDEVERVKPNTDEETPWKENIWPLLDEMPKALTRQDCINIILSEGMPLPPKSACIWCPFHRPKHWQWMRIHRPVLFWQSVDLERFINAKRAALGLDPVYFHRKLVPLDQATTDHEQLELFGAEEEEEIGCEHGVCMI